MRFTHAEAIEITCIPGESLGFHTKIHTNFSMNFILDVRPFSIDRLWVTPRWLTPCCGANLYFTHSNNGCIKCGAVLPPYVEHPPKDPRDEQGEGVLDVTRLENVLVTHDIMDPLLAALAIGNLDRIIQEQIKVALQEFQSKAAALSIPRKDVVK